MAVRLHYLIENVKTGEQFNMIGGSWKTLKERLPIGHYKILRLDKSGAVEFTPKLPRAHSKAAAQAAKSPKAQQKIEARNARLAKSHEKKRRRYYKEWIITTPPRPQKVIKHVIGSSNRVPMDVIIAAKAAEDIPAMEYPLIQGRPLLPSSAEAKMFKQRRLASPAYTARPAKGVKEPGTFSYGTKPKSVPSIEGPEVNY